jgi:hypothetical protein
VIQKIGGGRVCIFHIPRNNFLQKAFCAKDRGYSNDTFGNRFEVHWPRRIGSVGTRGPGRGVSGARHSLRHEGAVQEGERGEGNKREGEMVGKAAGDECVFRTVRFDAMPDAAGGEGRSRGR